MFQMLFIIIWKFICIKIDAFYNVSKFNFYYGTWILYAYTYQNSSCVAAEAALYSMLLLLTFISNASFHVKWLKFGYDPWSTHFNVWWNLYRAYIKNLTRTLAISSMVGVQFFNAATCTNKLPILSLIARDTRNLIYFKYEI